LELLKSTGNEEELIEAVIAALGKTGSSRATSTLVQRLEEPTVTFGQLPVLIRALGEIGDSSAIEALRRTLAAYSDDDALVPLLADSFARLGDTDAVVNLVGPMQNLDSPIARKQVAHAIGRLIDQGDIAYALLSQDAMTRDASIEKLIQEMRKSVSDPQIEKTIRIVQKTHSNGDSHGSLRAMIRVARAVSAGADSSGETASPSLCRRYLEEAALCDLLTPESVLLAFCALRGVITKSSAEL